MSYSSNNQVVKEWSSLSSFTTNTPLNISNWTNPNALSIPLKNQVDIPSDNSILYLPEPYWGNTGIENDELHSVVINYNPAAGGANQHYLQSKNLFGFDSFQELVYSEISKKTSYFLATTNWHSRNRAMRVLNTLKAIKVLPSNGKYSILNHLSIELIPWHTKDTSQIRTYISSNLKAVYENSILFAAKEASRISNQKLRNVVIMRMNKGSASWLMKQFQENNICTYQIISNQTTPKLEAEYLEFKIDSLPQTRFICIWKTTGNLLSRNDFPDNKNMEWIFKNGI